MTLVDWSLLVVLLATSGIAKAALDVISHQPENNIFNTKGDWWDARVSWKNKYKNKDSQAGPAFPLSTTALVFLTDFWHFADFIYLTSWQLAIVFWLPIGILAKIMAFFGIKILFGGVFEYFYSKKFRTNAQS